VRYGKDIGNHGNDDNAWATTMHLVPAESRSLPALARERDFTHGTTTPTLPQGISMKLIALAVSSLTFMAAPVWAQQRPDPAALQAAQREAVAKLNFLDGHWRGTAIITTPSGSKLNLTQTERVGSALGGTLKFIEGRGYDASGKAAFHAIGVVSLDSRSGGLVMRAYADGHVGDFSITPTADGFKWEVPAGPGVTRYSAVVRNSTWTQVGEFHMPNREPMRVFEMTLQRLGDTSWPDAGAVPVK
jgi:hypothetical protein